jgi:Zn-dependent peptidase ImmA (M78 family)/transcriptional regulator with XRE-family HTH domain
MPDKAHITPKVFKWARESARMTEADAAAKVSVSSDRLIDWEDGRSKPTIRQAQILAKAYRRPFALFFLPDIPQDFQPLQDYRMKGSKLLGTASIFIIREIQQKQAWISEVNEQNEEKKIPFVGRFSVMDNPATVADDILSTLNINPLQYEYKNPINEWIDKVEANGVFISRTSFIHSRLKLDSNEIQGFAISDSYAPFIFINSSDWNAPQLFTLVHELAHIWIAETGISNQIQPIVESQVKYHPIEVFCNEVAANALIPTDYISELRQSKTITSDQIFIYSRNLGISSFALLVRALNLNLISYSEYSSLKFEADAGFKDFLQKASERKAKQKKADGGPNPYLLRLNKNSRTFTQIVLDAYRGGFVDPNIASSLLNTPTNKFSKLEAQLYK